MKFLAIIFFVFVLQNDTIKINPIIIQQVAVVQKDMDMINSKLDSIIIKLGKDTINGRK